MKYFPHVFGANSFAVIDKVERLPQKVTEIYGKITY
jgi:nitric oxide reductase activation protein